MKKYTFLAYILVFFPTITTPGRQTIVPTMTAKMAKEEPYPDTDSDDKFFCPRTQFALGTSEHRTRCDETKAKIIDFLKELELKVLRSHEALELEALFNSGSLELEEDELNIVCTAINQRPDADALIPIFRSLVKTYHHALQEQVEFSQKYLGHGCRSFYRERQIERKIRRINQALLRESDPEKQRELREERHKQRVKLRKKRKENT